MTTHSLDPRYKDLLDRLAIEYQGGLLTEEAAAAAESRDQLERPPVRVRLLSPLYGDGATGLATVLLWDQAAADFIATVKEESVFFANPKNDETKLDTGFEGTAVFVRGKGYAVLGTGAGSTPTGTGPHFCTGDTVLGDTFEGIPAHSCLKVIGGNNDSQVLEVAVLLPGDTVENFDYVWPLLPLLPIPPDGADPTTETAPLSTVACIAYPPTWALFHRDDGVPSFGEIWGPLPGSNVLHKCGQDPEYDPIAYGFKVLATNLPSGLTYISHSTILLNCPV